MLDKIITIYAIVDDLLKAIGHTEDIRCHMSDAEIITTALVGSIFFGGNHSQACDYMKDHKLIVKMLQKSRFNRRLHRLFMLMNDIFHQLGMILKEISEHTEYLLDSFPIPLCDNIRIFNVKLIHSEDFRGYIASKKRYFYGVKIHLISTKDGIPVEFVFMPGAANDVRGLNALPLNLLPGSELYVDAGYTDYNIEDDIKETSEFSLEVMRKKNSKRKDLPWNQYIKQHTRHYIETVFSSITCPFPKFIHAVTYEGFLLKVQAFIFAFTIQKAFI
ncbi:IS982 family transposase [Dolichospermum sp. UHCC 0259]|uniref:IS982 family transposase n=1 Tax=Dolichospermum sp. UHCC 0259 TaxID=2590010 RepID=UPI001445CDE0|nr:IS982 family transposase [Dolichospermum sp. UHCC 0259]MTJ47925.1 IS982 family transposase [Dolichospermum sp. UHCC 0259]